VPLDFEMLQLESMGLNGLLPYLELLQRLDVNVCFLLADFFIMLVEFS
jgi:hypothetical protein